MSRLDVRVITTIWIVALFAASQIWGENPTPDEEIYLAAFVVIAGSVMTAVYLVVRETRTKKKTGSISLSSESEPTTTPSQGRRPHGGVCWMYSLCSLSGSPGASRHGSCSRRNE